MKIIIDIPEEDYKFIKDLQFYSSGRRSGKTIERNVINGIKNSKPYEERPTGDWIPVSERLPEEKLFNPSGSDFVFDFEEVLCTTIWGDVRAYKFGKPIGHDKPHFWLGGGIMDEYIIAWQYKPEPYKEVEE